MILIDSAVGSKEIAAMMPPELAKKIKLEAGDAAFFGNGPDGPCTFPVGIELKTAQEAMQCMTSGRLVGEQLPKMSELYKRVYLIIEGEYRERNDNVVEFMLWSKGKPAWVSYSKITYRQFDNWLNSLVESANIILKRSLDRAESVAQIMNLYHLWSKPYDSHSSLLKFDKSHIPTLLVKPTTKRLLLAQIPGVGWELSGRAAEYFQTVYDAVTASEEQWTKITGIGKLKAKKIVNSLKT